jgi:hypothetical protein
MPLQPAEDAALLRQSAKGMSAVTSQAKAQSIQPRAG